MENPIEKDDLGVPLFSETPICYLSRNLGCSFCACLPHRRSLLQDGGTMCFMCFESVLSRCLYNKQRGKIAFCFRSEDSN